MTPHLGLVLESQNGILLMGVSWATHSQPCDAMRCHAAPDIARLSHSRGIDIRNSKNKDLKHLEAWQWLKMSVFPLRGVMGWLDI